MSIVLDRPYRFIPPHRGNLWPSLIQKFRMVDHYLRLKEGVHSFECRNLEVFQELLESQKGLLLTPNHCRYADPLAMGWPARLAKTHVYAMASWHLFNKSWLDGFAIRKMGGFSVHRESSDRQSLEAAMQILASAERPLILFPEGTTSRMNDSVKELLDGVSFIARSAARKASKQYGRSVVVLPVAIKYLCKGDARPWISEHACQLEDYLGFKRGKSLRLVARVQRLAEHWLSQMESSVFGSSRSGATSQRRHDLVSEMLGRLDEQLGIQSEDVDFSMRIRQIRSKIIAKRFGDQSNRIGDLKIASKEVIQCQDLMTFDEQYISGESVSDTRLVEALQRMQESCWGKAKLSMPLHAIIRFGGGIAVPDEKAPRSQRDPLLTEIKLQLESMLQKLAQEAGTIDS
ncbi:MAG: 1-acyl-sn-glycerol-3-phosphate acyltransferase [Rubripirellula sp.]|nr:1-acyl-sn-glycerol-3-phosphate acyltransferase [Rubripirellula sp.]